MIGSLMADIGKDAVSSMFRGGISTLFGGIAQDRATDASKELMHAQAGYQYNNNLNSATLMRQAKEKAGFNINADGSISPTLTPPQAGQTAISPDVSSGSLLPASQVSLNEAQARNLNADAALKERELKGKNNADAIYGEGSITARTFINDDGQVEVEVLSNRSTPVNSKEGFEAVKDVTTFLRKDLNEIRASQAQAVLAKYVADEQITNGAWSYLAKMPKADFENLCANTKVQKALDSLYWKEGELKVSEKELIDLQKEIQEESSIAKILDEISKDFENGDYLKALGGVLKGIFFSFLQVGGVNLGFNRSRSSSTSTSSSTVNSNSRVRSHSTVHHSR